VNSRIVAGGLGIVVGAASALAVPPTINVTWAESPPPIEGTNYQIDDTDPDSPDVTLISESETWQIWSVDTDNPDDIGDIGDITATGAFNYGLTLEDDGGGPGARDVRCGWRVTSGGGWPISSEVGDWNGILIRVRDG